MTELLLPAGSLQAGLAAFEGGADAVYLGFTSFSARKEAKNFSFEEYAIIAEYAHTHHKRVYVALNTLISDANLENAWRLLREGSFIGADGIIVQDLGIARLAHTHFPTLPLHASTQLAVHTVEGVKEMEDLGFKEVVLARELTIEEIRHIRKECPSVKLEVFIHGALCYGFSGLCMASYNLCGRSANQGSCAQICRSFFDLTRDAAKPSELSPRPPMRQSWCFSMSDLDGTEAILPLTEMGIDTLKVEGRMKGPAYTLAAARYYRALLDGEKDTEELRDQLRTVFARRQTGGWLAGYGRDTQDFSERKAPTLGSTSYPGHRGIKLGTVRENSNHGSVVTLDEPISLRDGILYFVRTEEHPIQAVQFGLTGLRDAYRQSITTASKGQTVLISTPEGEQEPTKGADLYVISRHDQTLPLMGRDLVGKKQFIDEKVTLENDKITIQAFLPFLGKSVRKFYPFTPQDAQKEQDPEGTLKTLLSESDKSGFSMGSFTFENLTGKEETRLFYPISVLKTLRRDWYQSLDGLLEKWKLQPLSLSPVEAEGESLPARNLLCNARHIPWIDIHDLAATDDPAIHLYRVMGKLYLPLPPVMMDEDGFLKDLGLVVGKIKQSEGLSSLRIGLNNIAQVRWAKRNGECKVFADCYLYLANSQAAMLLKEELPSLVGGYLAKEAEGKIQEGTWPFTPTVTAPSFLLPLFISRSCFRHDSLLLPCQGCPHQGSWYAEQNNRRFHVMVKDCLTVVVEE